MPPKHSSLTHNIAKILFSIVILLFISTGLSIITMINSLNDAEAINISGSLSMQSYRLVYDITTDSPLTEKHRLEYISSLNTTTLRQLDRFYVPSHVRNSYHNLVRHWELLNRAIERNDKANYMLEIDDFIKNINKFVLDIQRYSELKLWVAELIVITSFIMTMGLAIFAIWYTRRRIVTPLHQLVEVSKQIQKGKFSNLILDTSLPNELGLLSSAFITMTSELAKLYRSLEDKVTEKTQKLTKANQTLRILYECSCILSITQPGQANFKQFLSLLGQQEEFNAIQLNITDNGSEPLLLQYGEIIKNNPWYSQPLLLEGQTFGSLNWQCIEYENSQSLLIMNIAEMLSRNIYASRSYKQQQQFLLMEERTTIARELHDSLAQSLSFLRIQLTLLRRNISQENKQAIHILDDVERVLITAYRQLRELLTTFRLTTSETNLHEALNQLIDSLQISSKAKLQLQCNLPAHSLNAHQQVHALQIVREAIINAIKHAQANIISVNCGYEENGHNMFIIEDDGIGISANNELEGHYGLHIMQERARSLDGNLVIKKLKTGGTQIRLTFPKKNGDDQIN